MYKEREALLRFATQSSPIKVARQMADELRSRLTLKYTKRDYLQKQVVAFGASGETRTRNGGVGGLCFIQLDYGCVILRAFIKRANIDLFFCFRLFYGNFDL